MVAPVSEKPPTCFLHFSRWARRLPLSGRSSTRQAGCCSVTQPTMLTRWGWGLLPIRLACWMCRKKFCFSWSLAVAVVVEEQTGRTGEMRYDVTGDAFC